VSSRSVCIRFVFLCLLLAGHAARAETPAILVLGDSLSAAYGMRVEQGWVSLLAERLKASGYGHRVVNASSSGETTGGALARLPRALDKHRPAVVIVELGGNDGLRGIPVRDIRANLESLVRLSRKAGAKVLVIGMRVPPNYGPAYTRDFHRMFAQVAKESGVPLLPFFLDGIALDESLMQDDGLHPNAAAQPRMLDEVWPLLVPLLRR